jgi:hypothetical protein
MVSHTFLVIINILIYALVVFRQIFCGIVIDVSRRILVFWYRTIKMDFFTIFKHWFGTSGFPYRYFRQAQ